ncbi:viral enhancin protein [[Clostridium] sordellii]|uniref:immunoglobulin-like domain-containing protein n=1 Tax=Paraclostridium sordellii TaxID=1505 RepID=UPI0005439D59|nr:immunoglobulin-like domain-containing protein [Paeniclostridium sordellii]CEK29486.1 viral enhancin protein [[Clostridium] sordellii] [Paeniclostridium sordellii]
MNKRKIILVIAGTLSIQTIFVESAFANNTDKNKLYSSDIMKFEDKKIALNNTDKNKNIIPWDKEELNIRGLGNYSIAKFRYDPNTKKIKIFWTDKNKSAQVHYYFKDKTFLSVEVLRGDKEKFKADIKGNDTFLEANNKLAKIEDLNIEEGDTLVFNSSGSEFGRFSSKSFGKMTSSKNRFVITNEGLNLESVNRNLSKEAIFIYNNDNIPLNIITFDTSKNTLISKSESNERYNKNDNEYFRLKIIRNNSVVNEIIINGSDTGNSANDKLNNLKFENGDEVHFENSTKNNFIKSISSGITSKYKIIDGNLNPIIGTVPEIKTKDMTLNMNDSFDPMSGVNAIDKEEGNITSKVKVEFDNVDIKNPGIYYIQYSVIDKDGNLNLITRKVDVKPNLELVKKLKIGVYGDFSNMKNIGLNRGNYHGREPLGFILPKNTKIEVRQVNKDYDKDLMLDLLNDDSETENNITIPKNGDWVSIENKYESVPFIRKVSSSISPEVEYKVDGKVIKLPIYKEHDDENIFFKEWILSNTNFAFIENNKVQMLVPKTSKYTLKNMSDFKNIDELLKFYTNMLNKYDYLLGLDKNAQNPINRNIDTQYFIKANKHGAGAAYYTNTHTALNGDNIDAYLSKGWLPLHELAHGYEYNIKDRGVYLVDVFNNILAHFYQRTYVNGDEGWLFNGKRNEVDTILKNIRKSGSYDDASYQGKLGMFVYLVEFIGEDKFGDFNKLYRQEYAKGNLANKNAGYVFNELFSKATEYNFNNYFDDYKIKNSEDRIVTSEKYSRYKNVFILNDIIKDENKAEQIRKENNLKSIYSIIPTESILKTTVNLEKGNLEINFDNKDNLDGETVYLKDGDRIIDKLTIDKNKKTIFKNIIPGRYCVSLNNKNKEFNKYTDIKFIDVYSGNNTLGMKSPYSSNESLNLFNQKISLLGLGNSELANIKTDLEKNRLKISTLGNEPHSYFNNAYAEIEVLNENNVSIYKKEYIGNKKTGKAEEIVDIKPGYKIKIYHSEPNGRLKLFDSDGTENLDYKPSEKTSLFVITDKGLEGLNVNSNKRLEKSIEIYAENLRNELKDNVENYDLYRNNRTVLKDAIKKLPKDRQQYFLEKYKDILNYGKKEVNNIPNIKAKDKEINLGDKCDPLEIVSAEDKEDGDLTNKIKVIKNEVDINKSGKYEVIYEVSDKDGNKATKKIFVTVKENESNENSAPIIEANNREINIGNNFDPLEMVYAIDKEDGDLTKDIKVIKNQVDINKQGKYEVLYEVADKDGNKTTKAIFVNVKLKKETINNTPVIEASDRDINEEEDFNILEKITATDKEDGDLTKNIKVIKNDVNVNKPGKYEVTYEVSDKEGNKATKTIFVNVKPKEKEENINNSIPNIEANDRSISLGDNFNPLEFLVATDKEDGDLTKNIKVIKNEVDSNKPGKYKVTYEVADKDGNKATKTINVNVKPKESNIDKIPSKNSTDSNAKEEENINTLEKVEPTDKKTEKLPVEEVPKDIKEDQKDLENKRLGNDKSSNNKNNETNIASKTESKDANSDDSKQKTNNFLNPLTKDKGILGYIGLGLVSIAGLYLNFRKSKK